eukprot:4859440-Alexandrium_andersonii.AAC.1
MARELLAPRHIFGRHCAKFHQRIKRELLLEPYELKMVLDNGSRSLLDFRWLRLKKECHLPSSKQTVLVVKTGPC